MASPGRTVITVIGVVIAIAVAATGIYFLVATITKEDDIKLQKNVLFITIDDYRPEMGFYYNQANGYTPLYPGIQTPNLDKMARKSAVFTNAYSQWPACCPSRASFLTSRRPLTTRVFAMQTYWRNSGGNFTTLPQYFKQAGYVTSGAGKVFHQNRCSNNDDPISWTEPYFYPPHLEEYGSFSDSWLSVSAQQEASSPLPDQEITEHTRSMLKNLKDESFFLAVGYHKPHLPFAVPERYLSRYPEQFIEEAANTFPPENYPEEVWFTQGEFRGYEDIEALNYTGEIWDKLPSQKSKDLRRAYYSCVTYIDDLVGELMDELETQGLKDNTIVAVLGDHGFQLGDHRGWAKHTTFNEANHVPLFIHIPGVTGQGAVLDATVELVDLFPTLAEAAGLEPLQSCTYQEEETCTEGTSLLPLIRRTPGTTWKDGAISQMTVGPDRIYLSSSLRTDRYRYTEIVRFHDKILDWNRLIGVELYDYEVDPQGNINVANDPEYDQLKAELSNQLQSLV